MCLFKAVCLTLRIILFFLDSFSLQMALLVLQFIPPLLKSHAFLAFLDWVTALLQSSVHQIFRGSD